MHDTAGTLQPGIPCRFPVRNRYAATVILCLMVLAGAAAPVGGAQAMGGADAEQAFRAWIVA
ncbi:MAG: hypothetical protein GKC04_06880, partial [Methanomicrobiales archaeon]|nr:hypothetical protein [Methanomicrobiales archaeon]